MSLSVCQRNLFIFEDYVLFGFNLLEWKENTTKTLNKIKIHKNKKYKGKYKNEIFFNLKNLK